CSAPTNRAVMSSSTPANRCSRGTTTPPEISTTRVSAGGSPTRRSRRMRGRLLLHAVRAARRSDPVERDLPGRRERDGHDPPRNQAKTKAQVEEGESKEAQEEAGR